MRIWVYLTRGIEHYGTSYIAFISSIKIRYQSIKNLPAFRLNCRYLLRWIWHKTKVTVSHINMHVKASPESSDTSMTPRVTSSPMCSLGITACGRPPDQWPSRGRSSARCVMHCPLIRVELTEEYYDGRSSIVQHFFPSLNPLSWRGFRAFYRRHCWFIVSKMLQFSRRLYNKPLCRSPGRQEGVWEVFRLFRPKGRKQWETFMRY